MNACIRDQNSDMIKLVPSSPGYHLRGLPKSVLSYQSGAKCRHPESSPSEIRFMRQSLLVCSITSPMTTTSMRHSTARASPVVRIKEYHQGSLLTICFQEYIYMYAYSDIQTRTVRGAPGTGQISRSTELLTIPSISQYERIISVSKAICRWTYWHRVQQYAQCIRLQSDSSSIL